MIVIAPAPPGLKWESILRNALDEVTGHRHGDRKTTSGKDCEHCLVRTEYLCFKVGNSRLASDCDEMFQQARCDPEALKRVVNKERHLRPLRGPGFPAPDVSFTVNISCVSFSPIPLPRARASPSPNSVEVEDLCPKPIMNVIGASCFVKGPMQVKNSIERGPIPSGIHHRSYGDLP
jgi:hypothetical protein